MGAMTIHSEIKRLRLHKGWSMARLAREVSAIEGGKPLHWQTVQQWEREPGGDTTGKSTAPKRERLAIVAELLGTTLNNLLAAAGDELPQDDPPTDLARRLDGLSEAQRAAIASMIDAYETANATAPVERRKPQVAGR